MPTAIQPPSRAASQGRYLLFDTGAVALNGWGIILPGCSGSGKSTLVAGLLQANFTYFSDEVAVIEQETGRLRSFPKSVCVKEGSRQTLSRMYPQLARARWRHRFGPELVAFLPPPSESWSTEHVPVRFVVIPKYVAGPHTSLQPIARSTAAAVLLEQSFNARALGLGGVNRALDLLRGADCFALTTGDLETAVRLMRELAATAY